MLCCQVVPSPNVLQFSSQFDNNLVVNYDKNIHQNTYDCSRNISVFNSCSISSNSYRIGAWNLNGWSWKTCPGNFQFKKSVVLSLDLDIYLLSETHLRENEILALEGYHVIQFNRPNISHRAKKGSGGVAIALNNRLLLTHKIEKVYKDLDGLLGLKLVCNEMDTSLGFIANYLPPDTYHYGQDPEGYFSNLSVLWSELSECDLLVAGGDLNSRTSCEPDFLGDIDGDIVTLRSNPDTSKNAHGEYFLQFLKDNRAIICNGRVTPDFNDYTFLSTSGCSVPDYIYCPTDHLPYCKAVQVLKMADIINNCNLNIPDSVPDHSMIVSQFDISVSNALFCDKNKSDVIITKNLQEARTRRKLKNLDSDFFLTDEVKLQLNDTIKKLETQLINQNSLNDIYAEIKCIFEKELDKLPSVKKRSGFKRKSYPFWNEELNNLWSDRCDKENSFSKFKCRTAQDRFQKANLRNCFKLAQKTFDNNFVFAKDNLKQIKLKTWQRPQN